MGKLELDQIKVILQNASSEIQIVQKEAKRDHDKISDIKVEELKKTLDKSANALKELKNFQVTTAPKIKSSDIQAVIDSILKVRNSKDTLNASVLQAILSSLQSLNNGLSEVRLDEKDHKRGQRVEKTDHEKL